VQTCIDGEWTPCTGPEPSAEACNGTDDDCDGETDETCCAESGWEVTELAPIGGWPSIATDVHGGIHLTFVASPVPDVRYGFRGIEGDWTFEAVAAPAAGAKDTRVAVTASGVHVAYVTGDPWELRHAYSEANGDWTDTLVDRDLDYYATSIAIDSSGDVHLSYTVIYDPDRGEILRYARGRPEGPWEAETVDMREDDGWIPSSSIGVDNAGRLFIAYAYNSIAVEEGTVLLASREPGASWTTEEVEGPWSLVTGCAMAIDGSGGQHISYSVETDSLSELRYAFRESAPDPWTFELAGGESVQSVEIDRFEAVHMAAVRNEQIVEHLARRGDVWVSGQASTPAFGEIGGSASMALDPFGGVHIVYDRILQSLYYAYSCPAR